MEVETARVYPCLVLTRVARVWSVAVMLCPWELLTAGPGDLAPPVRGADWCVVGGRGPSGSAGTPAPRSGRPGTPGRHAGSCRRYRRDACRDAERATSYRKG